MTSFPNLSDSPSRRPRVKLLGISSPTPAQQRLGTVLVLTIEIADAIYIDGVELRRDPNTQCEYLAYPAWIDGLGQRHSIVRPATRAVRLELEQQVLAALAAWNSSSKSRSST